MTPITVLFSSAGRRVGLIECFRQDALDLGLRLRVIAVDEAPALSAACHLADRSVAVPRCTDPAFIPGLLELCREEQVALVIPTIDPELGPFSAHRDQFLAQGIRVNVSAPEVIRLARHKGETSQFLSGCGIPTPRTASAAAFLSCPEDWTWPVLLKPAGGSSSIGLHTVHNVAEARALRLPDGDYIAQEQHQGCEYTVNVFFDRDGRLRSAVPHRRLEVRAGEVSKGVTERQPALMEMAARLGSALQGAYGALCFQAIVDATGAAVVFEINARFGGGYPLAHRAGARFSKWLLEEAAGLPSSATDQWQEGVKMLRYDTAIWPPPV